MKAHSNEPLDASMTTGIPGPDLIPRRHAETGENNAIPLGINALSFTSVLIDLFVENVLERLNRISLAFGS